MTAKLAQPKGVSEVEATVEHGTEPGKVMGTEGYMSPEQARGRIADHRSDIFAFGTIIVAIGVQIIWNGLNNGLPELLSFLTKH